MPRGVYERTPETREKMCLAHLRQWASPEYREKMRQAMLGHAVSPEAREKIRRGVLDGKRRPPGGGFLGHRHTPESIEKMRQGRLRHRYPTKMTSIERLLRDEFKKRRLRFEMHKTMFGRFQPDFVFESAMLIVEADGDYWHSRPDRKANDTAFGGLAAAAGWSVWRFGEREIKMHAPACARAVARFVRSH